MIIIIKHHEFQENEKKKIVEFQKANRKLDEEKQSLVCIHLRAHILSDARMYSFAASLLLYSF